jgi:hypothetical protein
VDLLDRSEKVQRYLILIANKPALHLSHLADLCHDTLSSCRATSVAHWWKDTMRPGAAGAAQAACEHQS